MVSLGKAVSLQPTAMFHKHLTTKHKDMKKKFLFIAAIATAMCMTSCNQNAKQDAQDVDIDTTEVGKDGCSKGDECKGKCPCCKEEASDATESGSCCKEKASDATESEPCCKKEASDATEPESCCKEEESSAASE